MESAFNSMMTSFIDELNRTFPEHTFYPTDATTLMTQLKPWADKLTWKDDSFFCSENEYIKNLHLDVVWSDCSSNTKTALWQYLSNMYMIGNTLNMFPPETMTMIEAAAANMAKNMEGKSVDESSLMSMMTQMMGGGGLAQLAGIGSLMSQPPKKSKKKNRLLV